MRLYELNEIINIMKNNIFITINGIFIIFMTIIIAIKISSNLVESRIVGNFKRVIDENIEMKTEDIQVKKKLLKKSQKYSSIDANLKFIEKLDIKYIDKSGIKTYISKVNIFHIFFISGLFIFIAFVLLNRVFDSLLSSVILGCVFGLIPFVILDIMGKHNSQKIRRYLPDFIAILYRWSTVKEDIVFSFEKSLESGIREPLRTYVKEFVIQINRGMDVDFALEIMDYKVDNEHFTTFINNIKFAYKSRGNIPTLLHKLEGEAYKLEEEFNRRKISTFHDRIIINICLLCVLFFSYLFMKLNPEVLSFYTNNPKGKGLMIIFSILYLAAFWISTGITKFNY